jgi:cell wall assembly regulator SMI1
MRDLIEKIKHTWSKGQETTESDIRRIETDFDVKLPDDYKEFLLWSNGGEGQIGGLYLSIWPIERLRELNEGYAINHYLPGILGIGSDGGGKCYGLDYRDNAVAPRFVQVPFGDLDFESLTVLGRTFREGLEQALRE